MIEPVDIVRRLMETFATGAIAELDITLDLPEQTMTVVVRRDPFGKEPVRQLAGPGVIHRHPDQYDHQDLTQCCAQPLTQLGEGALTTTDDKAVTCRRWKGMNATGVPGVD